MYNPFEGNFELAKPDFNSIKHQYIYSLYNVFMKIIF